MLRRYFLSFILTSFIVLESNGKKYDLDFIKDLDKKFDWIYSINETIASLSAYPSSIEDGEQVTIYWHGVEKVTVDDFVGVSCGSTNGLNDLFQRQKIGNASSSHGKLHFKDLYMMRCHYVFTYFNFVAAKNSFQALCQITVKMKDSFNLPKHGHLSLTANDDEMVVMYNSASQRTSQVRFGTSSGQLSSVVSGNSSTYAASDMCHGPANVKHQLYFRDPGLMHRIVLKNLKRNTRYYYIFGNDIDGWSKEYSFMSRPSKSNMNTKFIAYADMGVDAGIAATTTALRVFQDVINGFDGFLLHFGDISYALGHGFLWDQFFHIIEPYATRVPYMISIGNHEYDHTSGGEHDPSGAADAGFHPSWGNYGMDSAGECSVPMYHRWSVPNTGNSIYWYSFNYGGIHITQISSEHDFTRGSAQYKWLENDLASVDRSSNPWVILTSHRMMYTTQLGEQADLNVSYHLRSELESLLLKYEVNAMLVGHQHSYERSCPVMNGNCMQDGNAPVHIVAGSAGAGLEEKSFSKDIGKWSISHTNAFGYLRCESTKDSLEFKFILNEDGSVYDQVTLKRWNKPVAIE